MTAAVVTTWLLHRAPLPETSTAGAATGGTSAASDGPRLVSEAELHAVAAASGPVYWAGADADREYELTRTSTGAVFIRYLPAGAAAGSTTSYLTVATYPGQQNAALLRAASAADGLRTWTTQSGAVVVVDPRSPRSTYFSFPDAAFQVETFDPAKGAAQTLVMDGTVQPLGSSG